MLILTTTYEIHSILNLNKILKTVIEIIHNLKIIVLNLNM